MENSQKKYKTNRFGERTFKLGSKRYSHSQLMNMCLDHIKYEGDRSIFTIKTLGQYLKKHHSKLIPNICVFELAKFLIFGTTEPRKPVDEIQVDNLRRIGLYFAKDNIRKHSNPSVKKLEGILIEMQLPYKREVSVVIERSRFFEDKPKLYLLDFYIEEPFNFVIEVDGGYHTTPEQIQLDKVRDKAVSGKGYGPTIRLTNEEILDANFKLSKYLNGKNLKCFANDAYLKKGMNVPNFSLRQIEHYNLIEPIQLYQEQYEMTFEQNKLFNDIIDFGENGDRGSIPLLYSFEQVELLHEVLCEIKDAFDPFAPQLEALDSFDRYIYKYKRFARPIHITKNL